MDRRASSVAPDWAVGVGADEVFAAEESFGHGEPDRGDYPAMCKFRRENRHGGVAIHTPFTFPDGDGICFVVRRAEGDEWEATDRGWIAFHLGHLEPGGWCWTKRRRAELARALRRHGLESRNGEWVMSGAGDRIVGEFTQSVLGVIAVVLSMYLANCED